MKQLLKLSACALLVLGTCLGARGANQFWDMTDNPANDPNFLFAGNQAASFWYPTGGNPNTGGFMAISDAVDGQSLVAIFPVVDTYVDPEDGQTKPVPLKAFKLEADLRVGNSSDPDGRPADGFSISFARLNDPIIYWATWTNPATGLVEPQAKGAAGGDSDAQAAQSASNPAGCDSGDLENGTKTGVAIAFDAWQGNRLPINGVVTSGADVEGIAVRVDDVTWLQQAMPTRNGACTDTTSVQTGPWDNNGGIPDNLCWAPLVVELTADLKLNVTYKGAKLLDNYNMAGKISLPMSGRLVLMGRTGGNNQNTHVDNIRLTTTPADIEAFLDSVSGSFEGFTFRVKNYQSSLVTGVTKVLLVTGATTNDVTAATVVTQSGSVTTGKYTAPTRLPSGSAHSVIITYTTSLGQTLTKVGTFNVAPYVALPASLALPQSAVSGAGFTYNAYQGKAYNPNTLRWSEEQVIGLHGKNYSTLPTGSFNAGVNLGNNAAGAGQFLTETPWQTFGINADPANFVNEDNCAIELFAYLYFPTSGVYTMMVGSDDGYRVSYAKNAKDRMGTDIMRFNGGRGVANAGAADKMTLLIDAPGAYPIRMLMENGGGGSDLEWYFQFGTEYVLVNDTAAPFAIMAYPFASTAGPYIKSANPVQDAQNVVFYQPVIVELGDGTGTMTVNPATVKLSVDGADKTVLVTKTGDTTLVQQTGAIAWTAGAHTNVIAFKDAAGTDYSYTWTFSVFNLSTYTVAQIPASSRKALADIDTTKPGVMLLPYHTPSDNSPNNIQWTEEQLMGLHGFNSANLGPLTGGYYDWYYPIDFSGWMATQNSTAEWAYNADLSSFGGSSEMNWTLEIGTWIDFPAAGTYAMVVNSDDGFRLTSPPNNPLNRAGGVFIGQFNGGRGSSGPPGDNASGPRGGLDYMVFNIPQAGVYPFRLLWQQGGGGAGVEWTVYQFLPNGGVAQLLINDTNAASSLKTYQQAKVVTPYVLSSFPVQGGTYPANTTLTIQLQDAASAVVPGSIVLKVNGVTYTPTITQSGGVTTISQPPPAALWLNGANSVELTFGNGTTSWTYTYTFIAQYLTLTAGFPLGSEETTKPGFEWHIYQIAADPGRDAIGWDRANERLFAGMYTANLANGTTHTVPDYINWSSDLSAQGNFSANAVAPMNIADVTVPGLGPNSDNYAGEFVTYLVMPQAGLYRFGVNSDDGFKLTASHARPVNLTTLWVDKVASLPLPILWIAAAPETAATVTTPIAGKLVLANPLIADVPLVNAADIKGNIAVCRRGVINFSTKIANCFAAGAVAVIVCNNQAGDLTMGVTTPPGYQPVPAVSINQVQGDLLITALQAGPVYGTLGATDSTFGANGAIFNGGRGASDTLFDVKAVAPGVYPVRLFFYEGGGGDNIEFFNVDITTGTRTLIGEASSPIKAFRALKAGVKPSLSVVPDGAGNVTITWTGTLEYANSVDGQYRGMIGVTSPMVIPASGMKYYRASAYNAN